MTERAESRFSEPYLYTVPYLDEDLSNIDKQIYQGGDFIPDCIFLIGDIGGYTKMDAAWPGTRVRRLDTDKHQTKLPKVSPTDNILIFVGKIDKNYDYESTKRAYPNARLASLIKNGNEPEGLVDYYGRIVEDQDIVFYWQNLNLGKEKIINVVCLFYTVDEDGQLLFLANEKASEGTSGRPFKLIGGEVEPSDKSLEAALFRELNEETKAKVDKTKFMTLGDSSYNFVAEEEDQQDLKGYVRAYAYYVNDRYKFLISKESEEVHISWVRPTDLAIGLKWDSYKQLVPTWTKKIEETLESPKLF